MYTEVIILTLSAKWGKRCVAAYDTDTRKLIRLVSEPEHGDGIPTEYTRQIHLLDIVKVRIIQKCPIEHQSENVLIDLSYGLRKTRALSDINRLDFIESKNPAIFGNYYYKLDDVSHLNHSLELVKFNNMTLSRNERGKTKASFIHNGAHHMNYSVTDLDYILDPSPVDSGYAIISLPPSDDFTRSGNGYFKYVSAIYRCCDKKTMPFSF